MNNVWVLSKLIPDWNLVLEEDLKYDNETLKELMGAVSGKADIFLVPKGNYEEALEVKQEKNYEITILEVSTLKEAIEKLKNV